MQRDEIISDGIDRRYESTLSLPASPHRPGPARRWMAATALAMGLAACVDSPSSAEEARDCSDLVDVAVEALIEVRDDADALTRSDFLRSTERSRAVIDPYFRTMEDIQERLDDLNCDRAELSEEFELRLAELEVRSVGGAAILLDAFDFLNPFEGNE